MRDCGDRVLCLNPSTRPPGVAQNWDGPHSEEGSLLEATHDADMHTISFPLSGAHSSWGKYIKHLIASISTWGIILKRICPARTYFVDSWRMNHRNNRNKMERGKAGQRSSTFPVSRGWDSFRRPAVCSLYQLFQFHTARETHRNDFHCTWGHFARARVHAELRRNQWHVGNIYALISKWSTLQIWTIWV